MFCGTNKYDLSRLDLGEHSGYVGNIPTHSWLHIRTYVLFVDFKIRIPLHADITEPIFITTTPDSRDG